MSKRFVLYISVFIVALQLTSCNFQNDFTEKVKVSLRNVGHELLLINQDSTSLVLPVKELTKNKFQISFQDSLQIQPDSLMLVAKRNFIKAKLPRDYRIEVKECTYNEVVYSYEMKRSEENAIVPCKGRLLPANCYFLEVQFLEKEESNLFVFYGLFLFVFIVSILAFFRKRKKNKPEEISTNNSLNLGIYKFYPEQNKLIKEAVEIPLSNKECELLALFTNQPNEVIKREELMKKIWEDNGVVVGRSLDTYVSKLRKKLKDDTSIKITNIHGVGYKLEID